MDMVSLHEFINLVPAGAVFGTYLSKNDFSKSKSSHFCVDNGRRTVDGRRLSWLWMFSNGKPGSSNKLMDPPTQIWTKPEIIAAHTAANDAYLPMFTRHVEIYPELAITFCLPILKKN